MAFGDVSSMADRIVEARRIGGKVLLGGENLTSEDANIMAYIFFFIVFADMTWLCAQLTYQEILCCMTVLGLHVEYP